MREEEKIFAGLLFTPADPELKSIKHRAHILNQVYNALTEDEPEERTRVARELTAEFGDGSLFQGPVWFNYGKHTHIGSHFFGNFNLVIQDDAEVFIGDYCDFGPNVSIVTPIHPLHPEERIGIPGKSGEMRHMCYAKPVHIGDNCWLGASVTVCPGVTIGKNCVIGAGSVVTRDIPDNSFAAGVPCKVIRSITEADSLKNRPELWDEI